MKTKHISSLLGVLSIAVLSGFSAPTVIAHEGYSSHHHLVTRNSPDADRHHKRSHKTKRHVTQKHHNVRGHRNKHHAKKHHWQDHHHRHAPRYADHYRDGIVIRLFKHF